MGRYSNSRLPVLKDGSSFVQRYGSFESGSFRPPPVEMEPSKETSKIISGRSVPFPRRLLAMIRNEVTAHPHAVRWSNDGHAFFIDDEDTFVGEILPRYGFKASKMQSFQRNLNIYGFTRLSKGPYASGYVHTDFGRDINDQQLEWIARDSGKSTKRVDDSVKQLNKRKHDEDEGYRSERSDHATGFFFGTPGRQHSQQGPHLTRMKGVSGDHFGADENSRESFLSSYGQSHDDTSWDSVPEFSNGPEREHLSRFRRWRQSGVSSHGKREYNQFTPPRHQAFLKTSGFWSLPHAPPRENVLPADNARHTISTVSAPLDTSDRFYDRLFVKRCVRVCQSPASAIKV